MKPQIHVIGLGPGGPDLVTAGALDLIGSIPTQFLRTERHPAASVMPHAQWFDLVYESAESVDQVYPAIVEALVRSATSNGEVLYAVPGSPVVAEHSVELLLADERVTTIIHPAMSFLDLTWVRLGIDPVETGVSFIDGHNFAVAAAGKVGPLLVGQCDSRFVLSDIKLSVDREPVEPVTVLARLGLPDEAVFTVAWEDLDRDFEPDHLTSLWIPRMGASAAGELNRLLGLLADRRVLDEHAGSEPPGTEDLERQLSRSILDTVTLSAAVESHGGTSVADLISMACDLLET